MKKTIFVSVLILLSLPLFISILFEGFVMANGYMPPANNPLYKKECGDCHWAFLPGLLPERSWARMMDGLDKHFGEDASQDPEDLKLLSNYLADNAADRIGAKLSRKLTRSISRGQTPIRVTEIPYIIREHDEISPNVYKRKGIHTFSNCSACHSGANQGSFNEDDVRIPGSGSYSSKGASSSAPPKYSMADAIDIVKKEYPGQVMEVEMERGQYEIKLRTRDGYKKKFYVDPYTGAIREIGKRHGNDDD